MNKSLTRVFSVFTTAVLMGAVAHAQGGASGSEAVAAQVDKIFAPYDRPDSPGCALAVIKDGQIIYKRGYGMADLDHDIPIRPDTVFHVASVSKQFAAMAIMLLAKQGKVSLDDKVQKYITELREFDKPITIRHLLHHTSGLRDQWELLIMSGWRLSEDVVRDDDILDLVSRMKALNFPPGDRYVYSNTGYTLAAQIVKRVSGQSLREFAEANIFKPLGMARTFFRDDHAVIVKNQAYAYVGAPNNTFKLSVPNYDTVGASSLLTTVEDLARWDQNFYDYRVGGEDALAQMQTAGKLNGGATTGYGLGLAIGTYKGLKVVEHGGSDAGYRSHLMRLPDHRFSVACLCNLSISGPSQLARRVVDIYLADRLKPDAPKDNPGGVKVNEKELVKLSEKELSDKAGAYWASDTEELGRVTLTGDKLFFSFDGGYFELIPLSEKRFKIIAPDGEVTFESPSDGAPSDGAPSDGARRMVITLAGRSPVILVALAPATPNAGQLAEYAGFYYSDEIDSIYKLVIQDGKLTVKLKKHGSVEITPVAKDVFTTAGSGSIRFTRDKQNRVTGLVYSRGRNKNFRFDRLSSQYHER